MSANPTAESAISFFGVDPAEQRRLSLEAAARYLIDILCPTSPAANSLAGPVRTLRAPLERGDGDALKAAWAALPILDKEELKADPLKFVLTPGDQYLPSGSAVPEAYPFEPSDPEAGKADTHDYDWRPILRFRSSGTSGRSIESWLTARDILHNYRRSAVFFQQLTSTGMAARRELKWINVIPAGPRLGGYGSVIRPILSGVASEHTFGGRVTPTPEVLDLIGRGGFDVLMGITSYVVHLLREAAAGEANEGFSRIRRVVLVGEPVSDEHCDEIKVILRRLGSPDPDVLQGMSATELKSAGFVQCHEGGGLHVDPGSVYPELLHPRTRQPVADGEAGVLVWTHIDWRGTALWRYWTGDVIEGGMDWNACPHCGLVSPRLQGPISRGVSDSIKIKGTRTERSSLVAAVKSVMAGSQFQVVAVKDNPGDRLSRDRLVVRLSDIGSSDRDREHEISGSVRAACGLVVDRFDYLPTDALLDIIFHSGQKSRWFVDER